MNVIHYGQAKHLETRHEAYSDDVYEEVPFTCSSKLDDDKLRMRIANAIYKRFKPSHFGGCGYSCDLIEVKRTSSHKGTIILRHYHGIGD